MIILGVLLSAAGLGVFCWALFNLAVFALPLFAGLSAGFAALHTGAGPLTAICVGFVAGVLTWILGQGVFTLAKSPTVRIALALLFAIPAAVAGYSIALHLSGLGAPAEPWRQAFALIGGAVVMATVLVRLMTPAGSTGAHGALASVAAE